MYYQKPKQMYLFAVSARSRAAYITPLRMYPVVREWTNKLFLVIDDEGSCITCRWGECGHGGQWKRMVLTDETITPELRTLWERDAHILEALKYDI